MFHGWTTADKLLLASNLLTFGLLIFAGAQILQSRAERRRRVKESVAGTLIVWWQVWAVAKQWSSADLGELARSRRLDPSALLPRDWGSVLSLVAPLGNQSARLTGMALDLAARAVQTCELLGQTAQDLERRLEFVLDEATRASIKTAHGQKLDELQKETRVLANEAATLLEDAIKSAPKWAQREEANYGNLQSVTARRLHAEVERRTPKSLWKRLAYKVTRRPLPLRTPDAK